ncbi:hypothetical protein EGI22_15320 [Lacihabitans sp. LS3-19]|nr:hypothetical protein [Lacihabitans sp. LS3-19]
MELFVAWPWPDTKAGMYSPTLHPRQKAKILKPCFWVEGHALNKICFKFEFLLWTDLGFYECWFYI